MFSSVDSHTVASLLESETTGVTAVLKRGAKMATKRRSGTSRLSKRKRNSKASSTVSRRNAKGDLYRGKTRADLIRMLFDEEVGVEQAMLWCRMRRRDLILAVEGRRRWAVRAARTPCPKGHKPGDPACDLMCFVTVVDPLPTTFVSQLPKTNAKSHTWIVVPKRKPWWRRALNWIDAYADYNWKMIVCSMEGWDW